MFHILWYYFYNDRKLLLKYVMHFIYVYIQCLIYLWLALNKKRPYVDMCWDCFPGKMDKIIFLLDRCYNIGHSPNSQKFIIIITIFITYFNYKIYHIVSLNIYLINSMIKIHKCLCALYNFLNECCFTYSIHFSIWSRFYDRFLKFKYKQQSFLF